MFYVYILENEKKTKTYVGMTEESLPERLRQHKSGSSQFTKNNGPWKLKYYESFTCKQCAEHRETFFKSGMGRKLKDIIIKEF